MDTSILQFGRSQISVPVITPGCNDSVQLSFMRLAGLLAGKFLVRIESSVLNHLGQAQELFV